MPPRIQLNTAIRLIVPTVVILSVIASGASGLPSGTGEFSVADGQWARQANEPPNASFAYQPTSPEPGQTVVLNASSSSDPDGDIATYQWDIDNDGATEIERGPTIRIAFPKAGDYTVKLTVVDEDGDTNTTSRTISVAGTEPPVAALDVAPSEVEVGEAVTLNARRSNDPDGQIVSWALDTDGDGTYEETFNSPPTLQVQYDNPGEYAVTLRIQDTDGMTSTTTKRVVVEAASPQETSSASQSPGAETDGQPGFGLLVGLLGVLFAAVLVKVGSR